MQQELQKTKDQRQDARDQEVDANVHKREAKNEFAQLRQDWFGSQQAMLEAQKTARNFEKQYHETLVELERARSGNQSAFNQADQVHIQSVEEQLNNATQQLNQLCVGHAPSAAEGQLAVQQSQANEQLEALRTECNLMHAATKKAVAECDASRRAHLQLQMDSLNNTASSAS